MPDLFLCLCSSVFKQSTADGVSPDVALLIITSLPLCTYTDSCVLETCHIFTPRLKRCKCCFLICDREESQRRSVTDRNTPLGEPSRPLVKHKHLLDNRTHLKTAPVSTHTHTNVSLTRGGSTARPWKLTTEQALVAQGGSRVVLLNFPSVCSTARLRRQNSS